MISSQAGGTPTGNITLSEEALIYGSSQLTNGLGVVSVSDSGLLTVGSHEIRATYSGATTHQSLTSPPFTQVVQSSSGLGGPPPVSYLTIQVSAGARSGAQVPVSLVIIE